MVKTQKNGLRTIPPRRRHSNEDLSSCGSSSSSTPTKHYISTGAVTAAGTFYSANPHQTASMTIQSNSSISRKRPYNGGGHGHGHSTSSASSKKHRGKKSKHQRRNISDSDDADSQEKRNLHNDMERQRRIGLKNLFEELKSTIPNIADKERAPKVNILREATILCTRLTREAEHYQALKKHNAKLLQKLKHLRTTSVRQPPQ